VLHLNFNTPVLLQGEKKCRRSGRAEEPEETNIFEKWPQCSQGMNPRKEVGAQRKNTTVYNCIKEDRVKKKTHTLHLHIDSETGHASRRCGPPYEDMGGKQGKRGKRKENT